jgi:hypothetical protein
MKSGSPWTLLSSVSKTAVVRLFYLHGKNISRYLDEGPTLQVRPSTVWCFLSRTVRAA